MCSGDVAVMFSVYCEMTELSLRDGRDSAVCVLMSDWFVCAAAVQQTKYCLCENTTQLMFPTLEQSACLMFSGLIETQQHLLEAQTGRVRFTNLNKDLCTYHEIRRKARRKPFKAKKWVFHCKYLGGG